MESKRINCLATCKECKRASAQRKLFITGSYYCQFYGMYKNITDARLCRKFLCKNRGKKEECKVCRGGKR